MKLNWPPLLSEKTFTVMLKVWLLIELELGVELWVIINLMNLKLSNSLRKMKRAELWFQDQFKVTLLLLKDTSKIFLWPELLKFLLNFGELICKIQVIRFLENNWEFLLGIQEVSKLLKLDVVNISTIIYNLRWDLVLMISWDSGITSMVIETSKDLVL